MANPKISAILSLNAANFEAGMARAKRTTGEAQAAFAKSNTQIGNSFRRVSGEVDSFATTLKYLGTAAAIGFVTNLGRTALQVADELQTLNEQTGVSVTFFSGMQAAIEDAGGTLAGFGNAINIMQNNIGELASGTAGAVKNFQALGIGIEDLRGLSPEQQFALIADRVSLLGTEFERTEALRDIFGKGAKSLVPLLDAANGSMGEMVAKTQELQNALSQEQVARLDALGDWAQRTGYSIRNFLVASISDTLLELDYMATAIGILRKEGRDAANDFIDYNKKAREGGFVTTIKRGDVGIDLKAEYEKINGKIKQQETAIKSTANTIRTSYTPAIREATQASVDQSSHVDKYYADLQEKNNQAASDARELGLTFESAFEDAVVNGGKLGDVLQSLAQDIAKIFIRKNITQPLFSSIFSSDDGGGLLSDLFKDLPSYDVGTNYVPSDMVAKVHKGEMIIPAKEAAQMREGGDGGGVNVTVVNNGGQVRTKSTQDGNGTNLQIIFDAMQAENLAKTGSLSQQALSAATNRPLVRR